MSIFSKDHYNSGDGMLTSIWGPTLWHSLHTISFNYKINPTKEDKKNYYEFFRNLQKVLPCKYCRDNYKKNIKILKFGKRTLKNRETLSKFIYNLHELVNKNLDKVSNLTYNQVRDRYEHFRARCLNNPIKNNKSEFGCTDSLYGVESKCVLNIIPKTSKKSSLTIDSKCKIIKLSHTNNSKKTSKKTSKKPKK